jgi:hypothetical protein
MTEKTPTYSTNTGLAVTKTYSLTMEHISKVSDMSERSGDSRGEIVRKAIDLRWTIDQAAEQLMISPDELTAMVTSWIDQKVARSNGHES